MYSRPKLKNCPGCGKLFTDTGLGLCVECYRKREEIEKQVLDYVREHPKVTVSQIVEDTGVDIRIIKDMLRRGMFMNIKGSVSYPCSRCGKLITSGAYCAECSAILHEEIKSVSDKMVAARNARMKKALSGATRQPPKIHWTTNPNNL